MFVILGHVRPLYDETYSTSLVESSSRMCLLCRRPEYPAEEMEKAEIIDECEDLTPDYDDFGGMVWFVFTDFSPYSLLSATSGGILGLFSDLSFGPIFIFSCFIR